jgi:hypothetical protein
LGQQLLLLRVAFLISCAGTNNSAHPHCIQEIVMIIDNRTICFI